MGFNYSYLLVDDSTCRYSGLSGNVLVCHASARKQAWLGKKKRLFSATEQHLGDSRGQDWGHTCGLHATPASWYFRGYHRIQIGSLFAWTLPLVSLSCSLFHSNTQHLASGQHLERVDHAEEVVLLLSLETLLVKEQQ